MIPKVVLCCPLHTDRQVTHKRHTYTHKPTSTHKDVHLVVGEVIATGMDLAVTLQYFHT